MSVKYETKRKIHYLHLRNKTKLSLLQKIFYIIMRTTDTVFLHMHKCTLINDVKENATNSFNFNSLVVLNYFL